MASDRVGSKSGVGMPHILLIEPFCGGSHKQLVDLLVHEISGCVKYCLPAKKWHWRMRTSALYFAQNVPHSPDFRVLFASSVLNLAELMALRPDLAQLKKVYYFHENQLVYPVRKQQERDFQYGYNQVISCLVADVIAFNSKFNMESFLSSLSSFFKLMPDYRPQGLQEQIRPKCKVVYFPVQMAAPSSDNDSNNEQKKLSVAEKGREMQVTRKRSERTGSLHIVWPHRWEHDKDPETFFQTLYQLVEGQFDFRVSVLGEAFCDVPDIFAEAKERLMERIINWGYLSSREEYAAVLCSADVVVSTARHEFFGVAMLEAVQHDCYPLCPKKLVYPEIFPDEYLYSTPQQLAKKLRYFCKNPSFVRKHQLKIDVDRFSWAALRESYKELLSVPVPAEVPA